MVGLVADDEACPREESGFDSEKFADEESSTESESALLHSEQRPVDVRNPLPVSSIFALSAVVLAIDFGFAASEALIVPVLVEAGLSLSQASLVVAISPVLGVICQLFLGSLSDECACFWGRRRPFILCLCLVMTVGFLAAPFAPLVSELHFDNSHVLGITLTIVAVVILDFGLVQSPSRAYLLDTVPPSQLKTGNLIYTLYSWVGVWLGFVASGFDWARIFGREVTVVNQAQVVFGMVAIGTLVAMVVTVCSVREPPRKNLDSAGRCGVWKSVRDTFLFISLMSDKMWTLWLASLFGFIAIWAFLFFTTFVGEVVYGGVSSSSTDTADYQLYAYGVRVASLGLLLGCGLASLSSVLTEKLANQIGLKLLFLIIQYIFLVTCFFLTIAKHMWLVLILAATYGPYLIAYLTVPFTIIPAYHVSEFS